MTLKKCFGIVSWLPNDHRRELRKARVDRLLKRIEELWPTIDIIIIKQNWKKEQTAAISNNIISYDFNEGLGILKARQTLREKFLELDYDYLITMDDDCLIDADQTQADLFFKDIDTHPDGFAFIAGHNDHLNKCYAGAQFNLACLSKYILQHEPIPQLDPQKGQAYEDCVYSCLLHNKYPKNEFWFTSKIKHTQWQNSDEPLPTTWCASGKVCGLGNIGKNTSAIYEFIEKNKELPRLDLFYTYGILVSKNLSDDHWYVKKLIQNYERDKNKKQTYLYF